MCKPCNFLRQFLFNIVLALDHVLNALLLGDPNETVSRRVARARLAGQRWAFVACRLLSFLGRDHCEFAESAGSEGKELWPWSDNFTEPVLEVEKS